MPETEDRNGEASEPGAIEPLRGWARNYALGLLVSIYTLNFLDRQIVNILAEPIKQELGLRDWQLGVMTGLAFAIFYTVLGLPIARLAERGNRPGIIAVAVVVWSVFTGLCGFAQNFVQMVVARVGVGVGEAGCTPAAHSLISDYAPRERRASALALYAMGGPVGTLLGMALGGVVADLWGWRAAFMVVAIPGVVAGVLAALTLVEPRDRLPTPDPQLLRPPTIRDAARELRACRTFWLFCFGGAVQGFMVYGQSAFLGSFFFRNHGAELDAAARMFHLGPSGFLGISIGLIMGVSGAVGAFAGGRLGDRLSIGDPRGLAWLCAAANLLIVPTFIAVMLVDSGPLSLGLLVLPHLLFGVTLGPLFAVLQSVVAPRTRATAVAIYLLISNFIGLGTGPLVVGLVSDYFVDGMGMSLGEGIRWSQVVTTLIGILGASLFWRARRYIGRDMIS